MERALQLSDCTAIGLILDSNKVISLQKLQAKVGQNPQKDFYGAMEDLCAMAGLGKIDETLHQMSERSISGNILATITYHSDQIQNACFSQLCFDGSLSREKILRTLIEPVATAIAESISNRMIDMNISAYERRVIHLLETQFPSCPREAMRSMRHVDFLKMVDADLRETISKDARSPLNQTITHSDDESTFLSLTIDAEGIDDIDDPQSREIEEWCKKLHSEDSEVVIEETIVEDEGSLYDPMIDSWSQDERLPLSDWDTEMDRDPEELSYDKIRELMKLDVNKRLAKDFSLDVSDA